MELVELRLCAMISGKASSVDYVFESHADADMHRPSPTVTGQNLVGSAMFGIVAN